MSMLDTAALIDYRAGCAKCGLYVTKIDQPAGTIPPCERCGHTVHVIVWIAPVPGPEDENNGF